jgi:tRNA (guanine-N7-)-methyltransferase
METTKHLRKVRSFVRRERRFTREQQRALDELMPRYGLVPADAAFDLETIFGRAGECHLEIGFGNGASLLAMAEANPQNNYLGIEVHRPGVCNVLLQIEKFGIENVRVINADAVEVLTHNIADAALAAVYIFFPDPWHKTRHHKRRLVQPAFIELLHQKLKPGGLLHMATDWEHYALHMLAAVNQVSGFTNQSPDGKFCERPAYRLLTRFEQRGLRLGHGVWDLLFRKKE